MEPMTLLGGILLLVQIGDLHVKVSVWNSQKLGG